MKSITYTMMVLLISFSAGAAGQETPTLTIVNQAAEVAGVRVVGPTSGSIEVPSNGNRTIALSGGTYRLKVRYCDLGGRCRYSQTDPFSVTLGLGSRQDESIRKRVVETAEKLNTKPAVVALAWVLSKPFVTSPIIGASKPHHLADAVAATELKLDARTLAKLEEPYTSKAVAGHG